MNNLKDKLDIFLNWVAIKYKVDGIEPRKLFFEGEIWWCKVGLNIGSEMYGKGKNFTRPVVIVKKLSRNLMFVVPLSTKIKKGNWFHNFDFKGVEQSAVVSQLRCADSKRLENKIGEIGSGDFANMKKVLNKLLN